MQATSKGSDQTARTRRLIWGFAGRTYHIVGNLMSRLNFYFWKGEWIFTNYTCTVILVVSTGLVVASMIPVSIIVLKPIKCEYTRILDNMLLLRTFRYGFCKWSVVLEHRYVYKKRILSSTTIANIEVLFLSICIMMDWPIQINTIRMELSMINIRNGR